MSEEFGAAMRRALRAVRSGEVSEATGIIQQALGSGGDRRPEPKPRMRRSLREVVRTLGEGRRAFRAPSAPPAPAAEPEIPEGAAFLEAVACRGGRVAALPALPPGLARGAGAAGAGADAARLHPDARGLRARHRG